MGDGEVVRRDVGEAPMHFAGQASSVQVRFWGWGGVILLSKARSGWGVEGLGWDERTPW